MVWTRLPGLSGAMCKRSIIRAVGGAIGKVMNIDYNIGRFARM
ncbi:hypothetical protein Godav_016787, partial [Gossypium davidsonii]|nr:hypothetical protein [Gossypium davidsonii]